MNFSMHIQWLTYERMMMMIGCNQRGLAVVSVAGKIGHTRGVRGTRALFTESLDLAFIDSVNARIFR